MSGRRTRLTNLFRRLNAEYTGSVARNPGQELGLLPPRYDDKTFGH